MFTNNSTIKQFPPQKKADAEKTVSWGKENIDAADHLTMFSDEKVRQSVQNKRVNYDLYDDILDEADIRRMCNPFQLKNFTAPAKVQNYPLCNPKITRLVGEEAARKFEFKVTVGNDDAISLKETNKKREILSILESDLMEAQPSEDSLKATMSQIEKVRTSYQDDREILATRTLSYLWKEQDLKRKFNDGFKDLLLAGEEIYCCDIIAGEPVVRKVNPLLLYTMRSGDSPFIEDADIIMEESYLSPGQIIDSYYDHLKPNQIRDIERGLIDTAVEHNGLLNYSHERFRMDATILGSDNGLIMDIGKQVRGLEGSLYDEFGNIRVVRVVWKSLRKMFELTYFDQVGDEQKDLVDERYKPDKTKGETVKEMWISEWWEGTRIGSDIYIKIQPRPIQFRRMGNLSACYSGYVGTVFNTNDGKGKSLMDRMKPYQYLYNVYMYRLEHAFAKYKGPIYELDLSKIPDDWNVEQWLFYAEQMGWAPIDPFVEGKHGAAVGKLSGSFNTTGKVLDADVGNYIQHTMNMLNFLEIQMGKIAGISPQREGDIGSSEAVGVANNAITQSSYITEPYFFAHENTKVRVLKTLLETAKYAWKGKNKKIQYIMDDLSIAMLNVDGDFFNEAEYDVHVTSGGNTLELENMLKQLGHAGLQNDKINFAQLIDIYTSESVSAMARKVEAAEQAKLQREDEQFKAQQEVEQQKIKQAQEAQAMAMELKQLEMELKKYEIDANNATKIRVAELQTYIRQQELDLNNNGIPDPMEIADLALQEQSLFADQANQQMDINLKQQEIQNKTQIEREKLKSAEKREMLKIKQTEIQNKNQEKMQEKEHKLKEKELAAKLAIEKIKARNKAKPK